MNKPTPPQKKFLARIMECPASFHEQFPYGAHCQMRTICEQNGWAVYEASPEARAAGTGGGYRITEAGRKAIGG